MHDRDSKSNFQQAITSYCLRAANLYLYVQNIQPVDRAKVRKELDKLHKELNELTQNIDKKKN